jgi:hypothetical protein
MDILNLVQLYPYTCLSLVAIIESHVSGFIIQYIFHFSITKRNSNLIYIGFGFITEAFDDVLTADRALFFRSEPTDDQVEQVEFL